MRLKMAGGVTGLAVLLSTALPVAQRQLPDLRSQNVAVIAISPDGRVVATGERATIVKLWDARAGRLDRTLRAHSAPVSSLAFSPDGAVLATGSFDQWIRLWDIASGQMMLELGGHPGHVKSLAFTHNGELLASSGADGVRLWNIPARSLRTALPSPRGVVAAVFAPGGTMLASAGGDGVKLWNVATGSVLRTIDSGGELILALAFSPDGRQLAGGGTGRTVKLWDVETGKLIRTSTRGGDFVRSLAFFPDGSTAVVADRTATRTWNLGTGLIRPIIADTSFAVVALSSDGRVLAAAAGDDAIRALPLQ